MALADYFHEKNEFIARVIKHQVQVSVGPSTVRNLGAKGIAKAARGYLQSINLSSFSTRSQRRFWSLLNHHTNELKRTLPSGARRWGPARKILNIYLRDVFYNRYLCKEFKLYHLGPWLELPLDNYTARGVISNYKHKSLPKWKGVKKLSHKMSKLYQRAASNVAQSNKRFDRVHLDLIYWREDKKNG